MGGNASADLGVTDEQLQQYREVYMDTKALQKQINYFNDRDIYLKYRDAIAWYAQGTAYRDINTMFQSGITLGDLRQQYEDNVESTYAALVKNFNYEKRFQERRKSMIDSRMSFEEFKQHQNNIFRKKAYEHHVENAYPYVQKLEELFREIPPLEEPLVVYRGTGFDYVIPQNAGYVSTTLFGRYAHYWAGKNCCVVKITVSPGSKVVPIQVYSKERQLGVDEFEILLARNGNYIETGHIIDDSGFKTSFITYLPQSHEVTDFDDTLMNRLLNYMVISKRYRSTDLSDSDIDFLIERGFPEDWFTDEHYDQLDSLLSQIVPKENMAKTNV